MGKQSQRIRRYLKKCCRTVSKRVKLSDDCVVLYCGKESALFSSIFHSIYSLDGYVLLFKMTGKHTHISALVKTMWHKQVHYIYPTTQHLYSLERLGVCLGPTDHVVNQMSQVFNEKCNVLPKIFFRRLTPIEYLYVTKIKK